MKLEVDSYYTFMIFFKVALRKEASIASFIEHPAPRLV